MMERMKGMIAGFALIGLALGVKSVVSEANLLIAVLSGIFVLVFGPLVLSYMEKKLKFKTSKNPESVSFY